MQVGGLRSRWEEKLEAQGGVGAWRLTRPLSTITLGLQLLFPPLIHKALPIAEATEVHTILEHGENCGTVVPTLADRTGRGLVG